MTEKKELLGGLDFVQETMAESMAKSEPLPIRRIMERLDALMDRGDRPGAERHLLYWLREAGANRDLQCELSIRNEMIGFYRKTEDREKAFASGEAALQLLRELGEEDTVAAGTTLVNYGTACNAFGENERAMTLFQQAKKVYEAHPGTRADLLGGLYNNMALVCTALGQYETAMEHYRRAMEEMAKVPHGELEQAITCLNMADTLEAQLGMEAAESGIFRLLDRASVLLETPGLPRDGYYAFVCEKCAPVFSCYGYFLEAQKLEEAAREIHERT